MEGVRARDKKKTLIGRVVGGTPKGGGVKKSESERKKSGTEGEGGELRKGKNVWEELRCYSEARLIQRN